MQYYKQDDSGQWWYHAPRGNRCRVYPQVCKQCGREFVSRHKQARCSNKCRSASQKGVLRVKRKSRRCEWCKKWFRPRKASQPPKCCSKRCSYDLGNTKRGLSGDKNPNWRGGVAPHGTSGYVRQYVPGRGANLQHRVVMESIIGRPLLTNEQVHHKNGKRDDNRPDNLELWVKKQPPGQRVQDLLAYARQIIAIYEPIEKKLKDT